LKTRNNKVNFLESFAKVKIPSSVLAGDASICCDCMKLFQEYDKICKRAATIQDQIAEQIFKRTEERAAEDDPKIKSEPSSTKCYSCFIQFESLETLQAHECVAVDDDDDRFMESVMDFDESSQPDEPGSSSSKASVVQKNFDIFCYTCTVCKQKFAKKSEYQKHARLAHLPKDAKFFYCESCPQELFVSDLEQQLHRATKHPTDPNSFTCPVCKKTFKNKNLIVRHFGIHDHNRSLICELCGRNFYHPSSFQMHKKIHEKNYDKECKICMKKFLSTSHLNRHKKSHSQEKNYPCPMPGCSSRFAQNYNLKAHLNTVHYGIKRKPSQQMKRTDEISEIFNY